MSKEYQIGDLYLTYRSRVYRQCLTMLKDESDAEDMMQEIFIHLIEKGVSSFRDESAFSTWLYRVVANCVLMELRKRNAQKRRAVLESIDDHRNLPCLDAVSSLEFHDRNLRLRRAVKQLARGYGSVIRLHYFEDRTHREMAEILNCSQGTTKSQLNMGLKRLRKLVDLDASEQLATQPRLTRTP